MSTRVIQVRPSRSPRWQKQDGWEVFEAEGVCPVYCGTSGRDSALSYARQRAGYGRCDIQVLDDEWKVAEIIDNENLKPVVQLETPQLWDCSGSARPSDGRWVSPHLLCRSSL